MHNNTSEMVQDRNNNSDKLLTGNGRPTISPSVHHFIYLHCQAPPSMFCRERYKNSVDWLIDIDQYIGYSNQCTLYYIDKCRY